MPLPVARVNSWPALQGDATMKFLLGALLLLLLLLQWRLWSGTGSLQDIQRLEAEIRAQELENAELERRNELLRREVADLKTGQDAIEERARSELGLVRRGEYFYLINDAATAPEGRAPVAGQGDAPAAWQE